MIKNIHRILSAALLVGSCTMSLNAAPVVKAHMDTATVMMGKMSNLQLVVEENKSISGHFELFKTLKERGYAGVCGDSVELRMPTRIDTVDMGSTRKLVYTVPVQSFDSGTYLLPQFVYVAGTDTSRSNRVALKVVPVKVSAEDPIADYAGTADPEDPSFWDWVPDWVLDFWWLIIIIILAIAAFLYGMRRYRTNGSLLPKKPEPTPYEEAMSNLRHLKSQGLWEQGMEKEYFTDLTEILRRYLYRRFNINAMEMTSREILRSLAKNPETKDKRSYFRNILDMADFVKFAKVRPLPDDNIASYDNAVRFVEETKPIPKPEEETSDGGKAPGSKGKNKSKKKSAGKGGER